MFSSRRKEPPPSTHPFNTVWDIALFDGRGGKPSGGCGVFKSLFDADLTAADARVIKEMAVELNTTLRREAQRLGWFFVDGIARDFTGRGYCTGDVRLFVQAEESMILQGDTEGTVHPNPAGAEIIARRIAAIVGRETLDKPETGGTTAGIGVVKRAARVAAKSRLPTARPRAGRDAKG